jgi:hypothetical protein
MGQYVLEIGSSSLEVFSDLIERNLLESSSVQVLPWVDREAMTFNPSELSLGGVFDALAHQALASAVWRDMKSGVRYVLLYCPHFAASNLSLWLCTVEYTDETWKAFWSELGANVAVRFACVSQEEGLLISDEQLSPDTFPWSDPSLLAAAVRSDSGAWVSREVALSSS